MAEKTKIIMYGKHFAYIDKELMSMFEMTCKVVNFSAWIREMANEDFGLLIIGSASLSELDYLVSKNYYTDKTEWLREKMRYHIKNFL